MSVQIFPENVTRSPPYSEPKKNYTQVVTVPCGRVDLSLEQIQPYYGLLKARGGDVMIASPPEILANLKNTTIVYKVFNPVSKIIEFLEVIEKCLSLIMKYVTYFTRGTKYATIEVHFSASEKAREFSDKTLKTEKVVLLSSYMGRRTSCVSISEVPPHVDVACIKEVLCCGYDSKINILYVCRDAAQNVRGKTIEGLIQAALDYLLRFSSA